MCILRDVYRDDLMLIEVEPPVIGQPYGLGAEDISELVIAARLEGYTLFPVSPWPCPVYVCRMLDETITESLVIARPEQVPLIAWAELYPTREEAEADVEKWRAARARMGGD